MYKRQISDKEKRITAYHESGHALLFHLLPDVGPVYTVSIIPTGCLLYTSYKTSIYIDVGNLGTSSNYINKMCIRDRCIGKSA